MDKLKDLASGASGHSSTSTQQPAAAGGAQKEDYVDKAFDMGMKKSGHNMNRDTSEKITDGARSAFEKVTGKKVDPKISN